MIDWDKRARELLPETEIREGSGYCYSYSGLAAQRAALQLGREMAAEASDEIRELWRAQNVRDRAAEAVRVREAADSARWRARLQSRADFSPQVHGVMHDRGVLSVAPDGTLSGTLPCGHGVKLLGVSHDDGCESKGIHCLECCGRIGKPKTREQRLEEALREIQRQAAALKPSSPHWISPDELARRALECRP